MAIEEPLSRKANFETSHQSNNGERLIELESGAKIKIRFEKVIPHFVDVSEHKQNEKAVIFLPGWAQEASDTGVEALTKDFSDNAQLPAIAVTSRVESIGSEEDVLLEEARAIAIYLKESGLSEVTLAGYSQGGHKSITVTALLQKEGEIRVRGLILIGAVGLYEQKPKQLMRNFTKDALRSAPLILQTPPKTDEFTASLVRGGTDMGSNLIKDAKASQLDFIARLERDVSLMAKENDNAKDIRVPVVIISGREDLVSNPELIVPKEKEEYLKNESITNDTIDPREVYIKENIFKNSPFVRFITPVHEGHHNLPYYRSHKVACVGLGLLDRYYKLQAKKWAQKGEKGT